MLLLTMLSVFIPPPVGWEPPRASGPGTFCGSSFRLALQAGETIRADWPGEVFINDVFGTYRIGTPAGEVVITENGARSRPTGRSRALAVGRTRFQVYRDGAVVLPVRGNTTVAAVTVRFLPAVSRAAQHAMLSRFALGVPAGTTCLQPENR